MIRSRLEGLGPTTAKQMAEPLGIGATEVDIALTELEQEGERLIYEIELLTGDCVVREMEIDARDASVLRDELDD